MNNIYNWNPVYNMVMEIKKAHKNSFGRMSDKFTDWLEDLNQEKYNKVFDNVETTQHENFLIVRYGLLHDLDGLWEPGSIFRECRSIVIDLMNERLVLAPFQKFFNFNEIHENSPEVLFDDMLDAKLIEVTNKLDGSMQSATWYDGDVFMSGSRSINPEQTWRLADGYSMLTGGHIKLLKAMKEHTFIFEYIALKDAHVVKYKKEDEGLHLIGARSKITGELLSHKNLKLLADIYDISLVEKEELSLSDLLDKMKTEKSEHKEGWVLNINGRLVKFKCNDYVQIHKLLDSVSSVNVIIKNIADGTYDDMVSKVPDSYRGRVESIAKLVFKYIDDVHSNVKKYFKEGMQHSFNDRKMFMIWVDKNVPKKYASYVRELYLGKEVNVIKVGTAGYKTMKDMGYHGSYSALFSNEDSNNV